MADSDSVSHLYLDVDVTAFLRDAEYFMPFCKGYTAVAARLTPTLRYRINNRATVRGGVLLTALAGSDNRCRLEPVIAFDYSPWPWLTLTVGTLRGSLHHQLGEPMYSNERWVYAYKEDGLQLVTLTRHWESDTWLNWEHFLKPWTPDQERFTLGTRHRFTLLGSADDAWRLTVPLAFIGCHRGGQFSTLDTCIETLFNESVGLGASYEGSLVGFDLNLPLYLFQNASPRGERYTPFENGWGLYPQAGLHFNLRRLRLGFDCGYWHASRYIAPRGSYLFQSVSWHDASFAMTDRRMLTLALNLSHSYKGLRLDINAQCYYDIHLRKTDFVFGLVVAWDEKFKLF